MPGWTVLNCEMAACWKVVWNVDPLPLSVPLSAAALGEEAPLGWDGDEEHAERDTATARAAIPPTMVTCFLPRGCMVFSPYESLLVLLPE